MESSILATVANIVLEKSENFNSVRHLSEKNKKWEKRNTINK